jgi:hypothetical protein
MGSSHSADFLPALAYWIPFGEHTSALGESGQVATSGLQPSLLGQLRYGVISRTAEPGIRWWSSLPLSRLM